jgi:hypothetical protein
MMTGRSLGAFFLLSVSLLARQTPFEPAAIEGTVVDSAGKPVSGVRVRVLRASVVDETYLGFPAPILVTPRAGEVTSSHDGHFVLENVAAGRNVLEVAADGYMPVSLPYTLQSGQRLRNTVISLSRAGLITGRVLEATGKPAIDVLVTPLFYYKVKSRRELVRGETARTNDLGQFRLSNLRKGQYVIAFAAAGPQKMRAAGTRPFGLPVMEGPIPPRNIPEGDPEAIEIAAPFLYPAGKDIASAEVLDVTGDEIRLRDVVFKSARLGKVDVQLFNGPGESAKDIELILTYRTPRGPGDANIIFGASRRVRVEAGGNSVATYWPNLPGVFEIEARWGDRLPGIAPNERLVNGVLDNRTGVVRSFDFTGADHRIDLPLSDQQGRLTVRGLYESEGTLQPLTQGLPTIKLCLEGTPCWSIFSEIIATLDSEGMSKQSPLPQGKYDLASIRLPAGLYLASARQDARDALHDGVLVSSQAPLLELRFRRGAATVHGVVKDSSGHLVHNAIVAFLPQPKLSTRFEGMMPSTRTDQDGRFDLQAMIPGNYTAIAYPPSVDTDPYLARGGLSASDAQGQLITLTENQQRELNLIVQDP